MQKNKTLKTIFICSLATLFLAGCTQDASHIQKQKIQFKKAIAVLHPTNGNNVKGIVRFAKTADGIQVEAEIEGLKPGKHGFHIHQYGDCSSGDGKSAGGHFNPEGAAHAGPDHEKRHIGDLGNITADENGKATFSRLDKVLHLNGEDSIIGRGVIVHADADDLKSQPTGAAGGRVACGVVGVSK